MISSSGEIHNEERTCRFAYPLDAGGITKRTRTLIASNKVIFRDAACSQLALKIPQHCARFSTVTLSLLFPF